MRKWWLISGVMLVLIMSGLIVAGNYFYSVAVARGPKTFIQKAGHLRPGTPLYREKYWYQTADKQVWHQTATDGRTKLVAWYLPAKESRQTVILVHGFAGDKSKMGAWAGLYHELGFNVLVPDQRAAGQSGGQAVGYGWLDHHDYLKWAQLVVKRTATTKIVMSGISMGAAGLLMSSGEPQLSQIKAYIVDSPFTSATAIISYQAKQLYGLPAWPLVPITSGITKIRAGYFFGQANALKMVRRSTRPILMIAGTADHFVPTSMTKQLYAAAPAPKQLWLVPRAGHTTAIEKRPQQYRQVLRDFLTRYHVLTAQK